MAGRASKAGVKATFLPSIFPADDYRLAPTRHKVLFVNPIPKKGVEVALYLAERRPDIPFVFNLSWRIAPGALRHLRRQVRRIGNIELRKATHDRRRSTAIAASSWSRASGRNRGPAGIRGSDQRNPGDRQRRRRPARVGWAWGHPGQSWRLLRKPGWRLSLSVGSGGSICTVFGACPRVQPPARDIGGSGESTIRGTDGASDRSASAMRVIRV